MASGPQNYVMGTPATIYQYHHHQQTTSSSAAITAYTNANPYVSVSPTSGSTAKTAFDSLTKVLGRCGKRLEDLAVKSGDRAGGVWSHLKTSPSLVDVAMAKLSQGTKVLAEGGNDKVFYQTFGVLPGEVLKKSYACYLSTSSGPVIGTLYLSTARIAFCSDNPIYHSNSQGWQESVYYKVIVPLSHLSAVNPAANPRNPADKYIQIVTIDNHEFWFMGFVSYEKAIKKLQEAFQHTSHHA